jgi:hypothetical protein
MSSFCFLAEYHGLGFISFQIPSHPPKHLVSALRRSSALKNLVLGTPLALSDPQLKVGMVLSAKEEERSLRRKRFPINIR